MQAIFNTTQNTISIQPAAPVDAATFARLKNAGFAWHADAAAFIATPANELARGVAADIAGHIETRDAAPKKPDTRADYNGAMIYHFPRVELFIEQPTTGKDTVFHSLALVLNPGATETCNTAAFKPAPDSVARYITIAADSVEQLRRVDIFRVLIESNRVEVRAELAAYIKQNRPDLAAEVDSVLAEAEDATAQNIAAPDPATSAPASEAAREIVNAYEARQAARRERYATLADKMQTASAMHYSASRRAVEHIPFGQPILVGHHSERGHLATLARAHRAMDRSCEAASKAEHYAQRAASVGSGGISSDDPAALVKLRAEHAQAEQLQQTMKDTNKVIRAHKTPEDRTATLVALGMSESQAAALLKPDFMGRIGFPDYRLKNNGANVRRIAGRIAEIESRRQADDVERAGNGYTYREDINENRVMFEFPSKPADAVRDILKKSGFRWSPSRGAWVRQLNNAGRWHGQDAARQIDAIEQPGNADKSALQASGEENHAQASGEENHAQASGEAKNAAENIAAIADPTPAGEAWRARDFDPTTPANYAQIAGNAAALLYWQDDLDSFFGSRLVEIRNALRGLGWDAERGQWPMTKTSGAQEFSIDIEREHIGAGRNVAAIFWRVKDAAGALLHGQADLLKATPQDLAAALDAAAQPTPPDDDKPDTTPDAAAAVQASGEAKTAQPSGEAPATPAARGKAPPLVEVTTKAGEVLQLLAGIPKGCDTLHALTYAARGVAESRAAKLRAAGWAAQVIGLQVFRIAIDPDAAVVEPDTGGTLLAGRHIPGGADKARRLVLDAALGVEVWRVDSTRRGYPCAVIAYTGKAIKNSGYYAKGSEAAAQQWADQFLADQRAHAERLAERKASRGAHPLQVGDILRSSWGYDQTNVDYYEVTRRVGKSMVEVREIGSMAESTGDMCGRCVPVPGSFKGEPTRHSVGEGGSIKVGHQHASLLTPQIVAGAKVYPSDYWSSYA